MLYNLDACLGNETCSFNYGNINLRDVLPRFAFCLTTISNRHKLDE